MKWLYHDWLTRHKNKYVMRGEEIQISDVNGVEVSRCDNCEICRHRPDDCGKEIAATVASCISEFNYLVEQCDKERAGGYLVEQVFSLPSKRTIASSPRSTKTTTNRSVLRSQRPKILLKELPADPDFRHPGSATDANVIPQKIIASGVVFKFEKLDAALKEATDAGWPDWETTGEGGNLPHTKIHGFRIGN